MNKLIKSMILGAALITTAACSTDEQPNVIENEDIRIEYVEIDDSGIYEVYIDIKDNDKVSEINVNKDDAIYLLSPVDN